MISLIQKIQDGHNLDTDEIHEIMESIMSGSAANEDMSDFLTSLNTKGPTVEEITAAAQLMRKLVVKIKTSHPVVLDTCGTGGDQKDSFNISTVTALVVAGAGVVVAKHGNRSVSSRCGSACVLEALGVNLSAGEGLVEKCLDKAGIAFLFAQRLHPAMKHVAAVRKELGVKTIFNILGPLTNPAQATHQMMGVYSRDLVEPMAHVLRNLGLKRALVVHGFDGLDELTTTGKSFVSEYNGKDIVSYDVEPGELGLLRAQPEDLIGGDIKDNVAIIRDILRGQPGPARDIVALNAAYALYISEKVDNLSSGITMAEESIDSGQASAKLDQLVKISNEG